MKTMFSGKFSKINKCVGWEKAAAATRAGSGNFLIDEQTVWRHPRPSDPPGLKGGAAGLSFGNGRFGRLDHFLRFKLRRPGAGAGARRRSCLRGLFVFSCKVHLIKPAHLVTGAIVEGRLGGSFRILNLRHSH